MVAERELNLQCFSRWRGGCWLRGGFWKCIPSHGISQGQQREGASLQEVDCSCTNNSIRRREGRPSVHSPSRNRRVARGALIPRCRDSRYNCMVLDQVTTKTRTSPMITAIRVAKDTESRWVSAVLWYEGPKSRTPNGYIRALPYMLIYDDAP